MSQEKAATVLRHSFKTFKQRKNVNEVNYQNNSNKNHKEAGIWDKGEQMQFRLEPLKLTVVI